jgi:hypothetical protein
VARVSLLLAKTSRHYPNDVSTCHSARFEDIEHQQFGEDGFDDAVKQISELENSFGLADIAQFTAPLPPKF